MDGFDKLYEEDEETSALMGGVVTGRIHSIPTVKELLESIIVEAEQIISNLPTHIKKEAILEIQK